MNENANTQIVPSSGVIRSGADQPLIRGGGIKPALLQQRLRRLGHIQFGKMNPAGTAPMRTDCARFRSADKALIEACAKVYGGEVIACTGDKTSGQWEVLSESLEVRVYLAPVPIEQAYEYYQGGRCVRRCNGETNAKDGSPCVCPVSDRDQMHEDSKKKSSEGGQKYCKVKTRLFVYLADIPGLGVWEFGTGSIYAAGEIPLSAAVLQAASQRGVLIEAMLAAPKRKRVNSAGETIVFPVPELRVPMTLADLDAISRISGPPRATVDALTGVIEDDDVDVVELAPDAVLVSATVSNEAASSINDTDAIDATRFAYLNGIGLSAESVISRITDIGHDWRVWTDSALAKKLTGPKVVAALERIEAENRQVLNGDEDK